MVIWEKYLGTTEEWDSLLELFLGGFYQTYGWGEVRRLGGWKPLRMQAKNGGEIVAIASVLVKVKLGLLICWIPDIPINSIGLLDDNFRKSLAKEMNASFIYCRFSVLRPATDSNKKLLAKLGWKRPVVPISSRLSMIYKLTGGEEKRLKRVTGNWRHNLRRSNRYDLRVEHWERPDAEQISALYREMERLKSLGVQNSYDEISTILKNCKKNIIVYRCLSHDGELLAIRAAGLSGTAVVIDLLAAASARARKLYASHSTLWALLNHCERLGQKEYDLSGVDPVNNKGVFDFKHGTGAEMVEYLGEWEWSSLPGLSRLINILIAFNKSNH